LSYTYTKHKAMVIVKIGAGDKEREVEIVNEKGIWESGNYHLFSSLFLDSGNTTPEPHDVHRPNFLGALNIDKEKERWDYKGDQLTIHEQKEIAEFIMDYQAPDGVY